MRPCFAEQPSGFSSPVSSGVRYQRREPEKTLLHRIVRENLATVLVEAQERYPCGELPPLFAPSLSATCAADSSAMASPEFVVRLAMMSCWWRFPAKLGVSVHHALGDGWPTLRHIFETMCFPPLQFGSGS